MGGRLGCAAAAHGQDCAEPGRDGLGRGSARGRERDRLRQDVGRWTDRPRRRGARSPRTRGTRGTANAHRARGHELSTSADLHHDGRWHGRIARAGASPSTTSWTVGGSPPERRWALLRTSARLLLRYSTAWWPSAGIEQVLRTRSRSWPITLDTTGPARPRRGGVGCRSGSGSRSGRPGDWPRCCWGVAAGRASSSSSSATAHELSGIRPCGAPCSPPPRGGLRARAPGWPAGTPAWRESHEWPSGRARRRIALAVGSRFGVAELVAYHTRVHFRRHCLKCGVSVGMPGISVCRTGEVPCARSRAGPNPSPTGSATSPQATATDADPRGTTMTTTPSAVGSARPRTAATTAGAVRPEGSTGLTGAGLAPVRGRRRPWLLGLGAFLATLGSLTVVWLVGAAGQRQEVLAVRADVAYGEALTADDLTIARVSVDPGIAVLPSADRDALVGQVATTRLSAGDAADRRHGRAGR